MSRAIHFTFTVFAWLALPLWGLAVTAAMTWDIRSVVICFAVALTATCAWPYLHLAEGIEKFLEGHADRVHAREMALIHAIDLLACGPEPAAEPEPVQQEPKPKKLRAA